MRRLRKLVLSSIVALCAFAVVAFASVYAFAVEPPSSTSVNVPSFVTLTLHFSSVEGDDLVDPIVISNIAPETTVEDAVSNAIGKNYYEALFEVEGYYDSGFRRTNSMKGATSWNDLGNHVDSDYKLEEDLDIYVPMIKIIDTVEISAVAPTCGYETTTTKWDQFSDDWRMDTQTNKPVFSIPAGKGYHVNNIHDWGSSNWITTEDYIPFVGTFVGGESYKAIFRLSPDFGYSFIPVIINDISYKGAAYVNGGGAASTSIDGEGLFVRGAVTAVHDWDEGTVTKEPTTEAEGERTFKCKHCHGIKTESIAKLPKPEPASQNETKPAAVTNETKGKPKKPGKKATTPKTSDAFDPNLCVSLATYSIAALGGAAAIRKRGWN